MIMENRSLEPLKRIRANAYPAMESNSRLTTVTPPANTTVFLVIWKMGILSPTYRYWCSVHSSGKKRGGNFMTPVSVLNEETSSHKIGTSTVTATKNVNTKPAAPVNFIFLILRFPVLFSPVFCRAVLFTFLSLIRILPSAQDKPF